MLFRDQHDSGNGAGAVGTGVANQHNEDDETCSTGGRSYTSAESATAQSFEHRMAQLQNTMNMMPDISGEANAFSKAEPGIDGGAQTYLTPGYQLFPRVGGAYADTDSDDIDDVQNSLPVMAHANDGDNGGPKRARHNTTSSGRKPESTVDEDEEEADYLASLLRNIEKHAERLDTQFYRYPSSDVIKQQMATTAPPSGEKAKDDAAATGNGAASAGSCGTTASAGEGSAAEDQSGSGSAVSPRSSPQALRAGSPAPSPTAAAPPASSHSPGTKLFLGGLRYEVIQSGRHMVSWIFQVACGVRLSPSSILIHRKTKNGRSNVAPTGCASVFVANDADVQALLDVNQRIYCAEEGVYVSPSPEIMKELIASKDIVDVTGGRVRGPAHPVVIERAYSLSHHHGHRESSGSGTRGHGGAGGGAAASGGGGHRHTPTTSTASTESNLSSQLRGPMPPPYGSVPPPQYGAVHASPLCIPGSLQPPSYTPSTVSSSMGMGCMPVAGSMPTRSSSTTLYPSSAVLSGQSSPSTQPLLGDALAFSPPPTAKGLDPQRVTFHAYLRSDAAARRSPTAPSSSGLPSATGSSAAHHKVLFVAALPTEATSDYVSWLFSLMSITLPPSHIHIIGGEGTNPVVSGPPGGASSAGVGKNMSDSCATVNLGEGDIPIALNYHHRVLCTSRGAWIGHSAQDIAALRASDASLRDCPVLHVDRRMSAQTAAGVGSGSSASPETPVYTHGSAGGEFGSSGIPPYPPMQAPYSPPVFGGMPVMPAATIGGAVNAMPFPMQWGFSIPSSSANCMRTGVPPPPQAAMMGGAVTPAMGAGAPPPPPNATMPPPFPFPQTVTIGDRVYQLPHGATLQFLPVITPAGGAGAGGEAEVGGTGSAAGGRRRNEPSGRGNPSNLEAPAKPSTDLPQPDTPLQFSTRPS
ncbi:hypothetical protein, conserved [Leishmania donovani]|uniref:Uncharacterized protein n=1 Tax=Leishmania donovani TaxID=5661 RepID=E9BPG4_LEIDO|nr:hypothetical protein, conserved [Leishmania donovani]CBZ37368.1 hypothetical protein, conserved [Leishmania donovani]